MNTIWPTIVAAGTAVPPLRLKQEEAFELSGYKSERIRNIFLNSDIDYRHFYLDSKLGLEGTSDDFNRRYLEGAMRTGCRADLTGVYGSSGSERESLLRRAGHADKEVQAGADRDVAAAD